jgi:hypothetical protein
MASKAILLKSKRFVEYSDKAESIPWKAYLFFILVIATLFLVWYLSNKSALFTIRDIFKGLLRSSGESIAASSLSTLSLANLTSFQIIRLFILKYGAIGIYSLITVLGLVWISKKFIFGKRAKEIEFSYGLQVITTLFVGIAMITLYVIITNPIRVFFPYIMMSAIFSGIILFSLIEKTSKYKKVGKKVFYSSLVTTLLLFSSVLGIFTVYDSPITWSGNKQYTYMNHAGSTWMAKNRRISIQIATDVGSDMGRIEHYVHGVLRGNIRIRNTKQIDLPTHFGYEENNFIAQVFNATATYVLTSEQGKTAVNAFPENVRLKVHQYTYDDFNKLNSDSTINKIYENGELGGWITYGG